MLFPLESRFYVHSSADKSDGLLSRGSQVRILVGVPSKRARPKRFIMADITKCSGAGLDKCLSCYRKTAADSSRQSYFGKPPAEDGDCIYHWETTNTDLKKN